MADIILLPEFTDLEKEVSELRKELSQLIFDHDELKYIICENIKNKYMIEIGSYEYKSYKLYCQYMRLRRKKELIQIKINRKEKIRANDLEKIEDKLDQDFSEYQEKLSDRLSKINDALASSKNPVLTAEQVDEFKKTYRRLVKDLHPDLNPDISEEERDLYYRVIEVYKSGDYKVMRILGEIFENKKSSKSKEKQTNTLLKLKKEKARLKELVQDMKLDIKHIKSTTPYTWKKYLLDEDLKASKIQSIKDEIDYFIRVIEIQEQHIKKLLESDI